MYTAFFDFYTKQLNQVATAIDQGKTLAIVGLYGAGKSVIREVIQAYFLKHTFITLDFKHLPHPTNNEVYNVFLQQINRVIPHKKLHNKPVSNFQFHYLLKEVLQDNPQRNLTFIIYGSENLLHLSDGFFDALQHLRYYLEPRISFVLLGRSQLFLQKKPVLQRFIQGNYSIIQPFDKRATYADIALQEERLKTSFQNYKDAIFTHSKGQHGTIKWLCQNIVKYKTKKVTRKQVQNWAEADPMMELYLQYVLDGFNQEHLSLIQQYLTKGIPEAFVLSPAMQTLIDFGMFKQHNNNFLFLFESFRKFLTPRLSNYSFKENEIIEKNENTLTIYGKSVEGIFSEQEERVLIHLFSHNKQVVLYETLGNVIWKDEADEEYSLWAISQTISRIRKKLVTLGVSKKAIQTIRGKGYMLVV